MTLRFLIDECLSPELAQMARDHGYVESTCVRDRGLEGTKDWQLIEYVVANDFTLVTNNSVDFRGGGPGNLGGEHARQPIHAGLVCLESALRMGLQRQLDLFRFALDELKKHPDLVNKALDLFETEDGEIEISIYDIPEPQPQKSAGNAVVEPTPEAEVHRSQMPATPGQDDPASGQRRPVAAAPARRMWFRR